MKVWREFFKDRNSILEILEILARNGVSPDNIKIVCNSFSTHIYYYHDKYLDAGNSY